ncbi:MAG: cellulase family glycosylhydrolase [bacterium]
MYRSLRLTANLTAISALFIFTAAGCNPPPPVYSPTPSGSGDRGGTYESPQTSGGGSQMQSIPTIYPTDAADASFLRVQGPDIVNGQGQKVVLRGINFGNWLLWEGGSLKIVNVAESKLRKLLEEKADTGKVALFFKTIVEYHTVKEDFRIAKAEGLNVVRLCFHHRYVQEEPTELDQAVQWAKEAGIYVILNFHAAPGSQAPAYFADSDGEMYFWDKRSYQEVFFKKWEILANRYKGESIVAGYEILNEPAAPNGSQVTKIYKEAVERIRAIDPDHIIFLDGNQYAADPRVLDPPFTENVVYMCHQYEKTLREMKQWIESKGWLAFRDKYNVPLMCSEYAYDLDGDRYFESVGIHWSPWAHQKLTSTWTDWVLSISRKNRGEINTIQTDIINHVQSTDLSSGCKNDVISLLQNYQQVDLKVEMRNLSRKYPQDEEAILVLLKEIRNIREVAWIRMMAQTLNQMPDEEIINLAKNMRDRSGQQFPR